MGPASAGLHSAFAVAPTGFPRAGRAHRAEGPSSADCYASDPPRAWGLAPGDTYCFLRASAPKGRHSRLQSWKLFEPRRGSTAVPFLLAHLPRPTATSPFKRFIVPNSVTRDLAGQVHLTGRPIQLRDEARQTAVLLPGLRPRGSLPPDAPPPPRSEVVRACLRTFGARRRAGTAAGAPESSGAGSACSAFRRPPRGRRGCLECRRPCCRAEEDGGPEQRHRRRRVRGALHRLLHLLRPQEAERPELQEQASGT